MSIGWWNFVGFMMVAPPPGAGGGEGFSERGRFGTALRTVTPGVGCGAFLHAADNFAPALDGGYGGGRLVAGWYRIGPRYFPRGDGAGHKIK